MVHQERLRRAANDRIARRMAGNVRPFGIRLLLRLGDLVIAGAGRLASTVQRIQASRLAVAAQHVRELRRESWDEYAGPLESGSPER